MTITYGGLAIFKQKIAELNTRTGAFLLCDLPPIPVTVSLSAGEGRKGVAGSSSGGEGNGAVDCEGGGDAGGVAQVAAKVASGVKVCNAVKVAGGVKVADAPASLSLAASAGSSGTGAGVVGGKIGHGGGGTVDMALGLM